MSESTAPSTASTTSSTAPAAGDESGQASPNLGESTPPPAKKPKKYFDIDGERVEEEEITRNYKKYRSADAKFREAADTRRQVEQFMEALQKDPEAVLNDPRLSIDRKKLAEKWLLDIIQKDMTPQDPRQAEIEAYQKKLREYEDKERQAKDAEEKTELAKRIDKRRDEIASIFQKAIEISPLSKDQGTAAEVVREMATYMRICNKNGYEVTPEELAKHVESRFTKSYQSLVGNMDGEDLVNFLGKDIIKKLRKYDLAKIQASRASKEPAVSDKWEPSTRESRTEFVDPRKLKAR